MPSEEDDGILRTNIVTLVSRILTEHMSFFKYTFDDVVDWHMKHQYYAEMSSASIVVSTKEARIAYIYDFITYVQVPLGVLLKNENKGNDMVNIVTHLHQYVPVIENTSRIEVPGIGEEVDVKTRKMRKRVISSLLLEPGLLSELR